MSKLSEALSLADELCKSTPVSWELSCNAAAELRRLHEVNQELVEALEELMYARTDKAERMAETAIAKAKGE